MSNGHLIVLLRDEEVVIGAFGPYESEEEAVSTWGSCGIRRCKGG